MPRSKTRFTTEDAILGWIDKYTTKIAELEAEAAKYEQHADEFRNTEHACKIEGLRDLAEKVRKRADWRRARIKTLSELLAEFRTRPMEEIMKGDNSVKGI